MYNESRHKSRQGKPVFIDTPTGRRCAGYLITHGGKLILQKTRVQERKHFCKKHRAWGIELALLEHLRVMGVDRVRIVTEDTRVIEEAPLAAFVENGICDDLGFGLQMFLPRAFFRRVDRFQGSLFGGDLDD